MFRFYNNNLNIQSKLTLTIVATVLIPFAILATAFSNKLYNMIISDTIRSAQEDSEITSPLINKEIDKIFDITLSITSMSYYDKVFYTSAGRSLDEIPYSLEASQFQSHIKDLEKQGYNVRFYSGVPTSSRLYTASTSKNVFLPMSEAKGTYWYGIFQGSKCSSLFCPAAYLGKQEAEKYGDNAYISYSTIYYNGEIFPCYMAIYYSSSLYSNILADNMSFKNGVSYIINDREEIVASTDAALSSTYRLDYSDISESLMSSNSFIERDVLGTSVYVAFYYLSTPKWFIVTVIPKEPLLAEGNQMIFKFVFLVMLCLLLAILMAFFQSKSITSRITDVIHQMDQVRDGPPIPMKDSDSSDEVGELIRTYNYMATEMQQLIIKEQRTAENLRIAEFNALQAQINPHFLYNTMDMINWMSKEGRNDDVSEVVQRLSRFYKLTLSKKNTINSISDELEHTSLYVQLMNMRHLDAIDLVIDMPDEITNFSIPKLTLQPIIENAITHGILEKEEKQGTIIITGWEENDDIVLLVSDDGVGISEEKLKVVLTDKPVGPTKGSNVAVSNIHHRLKILYGDSYGLSYSSTLGQGTEVTIRIPELIG